MVMLVTAVIIFIWRISVPDILTNFAGLSVLYLVLVLSLSIMVTIIGWFGASMTFPVEKD